MHGPDFHPTRRSVLAAAVAAAVTSTSRAAQPKPDARILLHSNWQTINIGDIGHTPGTLAILEKHLPGVQVTLWAAALNKPVEDMLRRRFPNVPIVRGRFAAGGKLSDAALQKAFDEADLYLYNSGMGLSAAPLRFCRAAGKPYGVYGQSVEPRQFEREKDFAELLTTAAFVYARDSVSLKTMKEMGVRCPVTEFAPDGCFGIDVRDDDRAAAYLKGLGLADRQFITVTLRTNTGKLDGSDSPNNPRNPTPQQKQADEERALKLREVITAFMRKTGLAVLNTVEVDKEITHNRRMLLDPLPEDVRKRVFHRDTFWNADEAAGIFARARAVVCHEPHSCIIALANGTPALHPASAQHGPKRWMFKDLGLGQWLFDIDAEPAGRISDALLAVHGDFNAARAAVDAAMKLVRRRQAETADVIRRVLPVKGGA